MEPYHRSASLLRVLANPGRLNLLDLLTDRELTLPEIQQWVEMDSASLTRHLAVLRRTGLVRERRTGRVARYSAEPELAASLFEVLERAGDLSAESKTRGDSLMRQKP